MADGRFHIRDVRPTDQAACAEVFVESYRHAFRWEAPDEVSPDRYFESIAGEQQWVALDDDKVIALISVDWSENFVHSLYVLPAYHRRGAGSALLARVLGEARGPCELKCDKQNRAAMDFYLQTGWRVVGEGLSQTGPWFRLRKYRVWGPR
jgi:GNAT superfamily N-acetyltransferase